MYGERITQERERLGLTQSELAEKLDVSQKSISKYERDDRRPNFETIAKMSHLFGVTADYLLGISSRDTAAGSASTLSPEEQDVIDAYRKADEGIKISVCKLLDVKKEEVQIKDA